MSLEAALDEERLAILDILEGNAAKHQQKPAHQRPSYRHYRNAITGEPLTDAPATASGGGSSRPTSPSPVTSRSNSLHRYASLSPAPVVRSMLDIASPPLSFATGPSATASVRPQGQVVRSMLDPTAPAPPPVPLPIGRSQSRPGTPVTHRTSLSPAAFAHDRRASDSAAKALPEFRRALSASAGRREELPPGVGRDINGGYYDLDSGLPVKIPSTSPTAADRTRSMASIMSGGELPHPGSLQLKDHAAAAAALEDPLAMFKDKKSKKKKKNQRRSLLNNPNAEQLITSSHFTTESGEVIKFNEAYRKLSDAAIAKASGALGELYRASSQERSTGLKIGEGGEIRLAKDDLDEEAVLSTDSSSDDEDDEHNMSSSDEDDWRGRSRNKVSSLLNDGDDEDDNDEEGEKGFSEEASVHRKKDKHRKKEEKREARSLLAAAEEERKQVTYKYRSLLDGLPDPTKARQGSSYRTRKVHPASSFDSGSPSASNSAVATPVGSEDEAEYSDIKKAQNLSIYLSPADTSVPNRVIQTIVRGEWSSVMKELEEDSASGKKKLRTYLVATDLSEEAEHALEWTFGTIARDGDTIYVVYAIDEEVANKANSKLGPAAAVDSPVTGEVRDGKRVVADIAAVVGSQTEKTMKNPRPMRYSIGSGGIVGRSLSRGGRDSPRALSHHRAGGATSARGSMSGNATGAGAAGAGATISCFDTARSLLEKERRRALERITSKCIHLLRKTRLQVRVAIEVIHCKNPKHLITEAIDGLQPTMVILGSRGRSALKGVLLGSFSNYLVSKSSKPVMVARKKLRKHATGSRLISRQTNNLKTPKGLASAKID
ncbi:dual specificity protein kinase kns1 [Ascosphaera pollenicola]|nr:dual specificity protein kinase kns1 [Ascosphaera pollenicola]